MARGLSIVGHMAQQALSAMVLRARSVDVSPCGVRAT